MAPEQAEAEPISVASEQLATVGHTISATPTDHAKDGPRNHIHEPGASASDFADCRPRPPVTCIGYARPKYVWVNFALTAAVMTLLVWGIVQTPRDLDGGCRHLR